MSGTQAQPSGAFHRSSREWLRAALPAFLLPMMFALAGCGFGRSGPPPAALFDLGVAPPSTEALPKREPLAVTFSATQMLTDTGVIWRVGDSASPQSYATYRWAAPPSQLVQQRLVERLSAEGPVMTDTVDPRAPLLQVSLTRFEQVYAPDGASSQGQVVLQVVLLRDRHAVDSVRVARNAPAPTQDASGGVMALRSATDAAVDDLAVWLSTHVPSTAPRADGPGPRGPEPVASHSPPG